MMLIIEYAVALKDCIQNSTSFLNKVETLCRSKAIIPFLINFRVFQIHFKIMFYLLLASNFILDTFLKTHTSIMKEKPWANLFCLLIYTLN